MLNFIIFYAYIPVALYSESGDFGNDYTDVV